MPNNDYWILNQLEDYETWGAEFERLVADANPEKMGERAGYSSDGAVVRDLCAAARGFALLIHQLLERSRGNVDESENPTVNPAVVMTELAQSWLGEEENRIMRRLKSKDRPKPMEPRPGFMTIPLDVYDALLYCRKHPDCVGAMSISLDAFIKYVFNVPNRDPQWERPAWKYLCTPETTTEQGKEQ